MRGVTAVGNPDASTPEDAGIDVLLSDSMVAGMPLPKRPHKVMLARGATVEDMLDGIQRKDLLVKDYRTIGILLATNNCDYRVWGHQVNRAVNPLTVESMVRNIMWLYKKLIKSIQKQNPLAFIVIFSILPRPVDHEDTHMAVKALNQSLKAYCIKRNLGWSPIWTSFAAKKPGTSQCLPITSLYNKGGLHLNKRGLAKLSERLEQVFAEKELRTLANRSHFQFL